MTCAEIREYILQHPDMPDSKVGKILGCNRDTVKWNRQQLGIYRGKAKPINETGNRYGKLTVLYKDCSGEKKYGAHWVCRCDCGNITVVKGANLRNRMHPTRSCGCDHYIRAIDLWDNGVWKRIDENHIQCCKCGYTKLLGKLTRSYVAQCSACAREERRLERRRKCSCCGQILEEPRKRMCPECRDARQREAQRKQRLKRGTLHERARYARAKANGRIDWSINLDELIQRDCGICALCGQPVDTSAYHTTAEGYFITHGTYPSIDHIIPLSRGGTHTWNNVQLAHCKCNSLKSNAT